MDDFGKKLREYREQRGWDRKRVAMYTNVPPSTLKAWELGDRIPTDYLQELLFFKLNRVGRPDKKDGV